MYRIRLLLFLVCVFVSARAQQPFTKEFWLNESNIAVKVNALLYSTDHYIWLATDHGLYRFNGRDFLQIADSIKQPATAIAEVNGEIYTGYKNGTIGIVVNNAVSSIRIRNKFPTSSITSLHAKGKLLYVTTEAEGLFLIINNTGLQLSADEGLTDNFSYDAVIANDKIMVGTDRGVNHIRWNGKKPVIKIFTTAQGLPDNIVRVVKPIPHTSQSWIGTQEGGVAMYDDENETFQTFKMSSQWAWGQINDMLPMNKNEAWIATEDGYLLQAKIFKDSLDIQPFTYHGVKFTKLLKDNAGNIWCASNKGLLMNTVLYAAHIKPSGAYDLKKVTAITCDDANNLWFTQNNELYKMPLDKNEAPKLVVKTEASITCLYADARNNLWIGTFGKGLFYFNKEKLTAVRNIAALAEGHILSIASINDRLWIASLNGVEETKIEDYVTGSLKILKHHNKLSGTGSDYIYQLYPDTKGRMWMATDGGGVCMYDGQKYYRWNDSSGMISNVVYCITEDASGNIWAGTLEKGLFRLRNNSWCQFTQEDGLQDMNIYALNATSTGQIIIVNEDGIDQWYPQNKQFRHFNRRLGIGIDSTLAIPNCIAGDRNGNVYVPFEQGFIMFKKQLEDYGVAPFVKINSISLFNEPLHTARSQFSYNENHISFRFDGINFSNPEQLQYRYKLDNYDTNWIYTNDEVVPFVQLQAGGFTFHVQASLNNSFINAAEEVYEFTIIKPYWQRTWFITFIALVLFGAGYGYVKIREQNIKKMSKLQKERMAFEYEHLKSQVNPHFLFNSLNTLVSLIEDDKNAAVDYTVHLSDLYRNMLSYKDQDMISLAEEYEIIKNYMYIQNSRFGNALQLHTDIPQHLFKTKKIVPLALQLLVENAIKHNVVSLSRPLTISIIADEETITVKNHIQPKASKEKGAGLGLTNIKKRYGLLTHRNTKFGIEGKEYIVTLPLL